MDLPVPSRFAVERELMERVLIRFVRGAWPVVEPGSPFVSGRHLEMVCEHLAAVVRGEITRLLINIPPRHMKSLAAGVFAFAWAWTRAPHLRFLYASHKESLAVRDSLRCRRLLTSPWYRSRWGGRFALAGDGNRMDRFENDRGGIRLATGVAGGITGEGGDVIVADDPHGAGQVESPARREAVLTWWDEVMSTRLNDPATGRLVIIMQRLHEGDLSGHVLAQGGYEHLCLPARFEENRVRTSLGVPDFRTRKGETLWPERFGHEALSDLEKRLGSFGAAGQLQQRPAPRGGGLFLARNFRAADLPPGPAVRRVRYWDKAATADGGKRTAGVLMGLMEDGVFAVLDVVKGRWSAGERERIIRETAEADGVNVWVVVEQEPGSGGKESAENTLRNLAGFRVFADRVTGDKVTRAEPYAAQVEAGNVILAAAPWNREFVDEHASFPRGRFADQVDAASGAFNALARRRKKAGAW